MQKFIVFFLFLIVSTISTAQSKDSTVVAVKGDGVYSLLRKNGLKPSDFYQQFLALNKDNLSSDNGLFVGKSYVLPIVDSIAIIKIDSTLKEPPVTIPPKKSVDNTTILLEKNKHPFFGKDINSLPIEGDNLKGAIYYLIAGHGGPDPGALGTYNGKRIPEDEYAYDVTLRLASMLISRGAKVFMIIKDPNDGIRNESILKIDYDEVNYLNKSIPRSQLQRLQQRAQNVNDLYLKHKKESNYQRLLEIHVDSRSKKNTIDVFFYHHKNSKNGKRMVENLQQSFRQKYAQHQPNRKYPGTIGSRNLYTVKNTLPPIAYIELGNINNAKDQKRITNHNNRQALAKWILNGLEADYGIKP